MRSRFLIGLTLALLWPVSSQAIETGFYITGAYGVRHLNGMSVGSERTFDISAPQWGEIEIEETGPCISVGVYRGEVFGYNLKNKALDGFSLRAGYRFSSKWALTVGFDDYRSKDNQYSLPWAADPGGINAGRHGSFTVNSEYSQADLSLMVEYHLPRLGVFIAAGREVRFFSDARYITWRRYRDGVLTRTVYDNYRYSAVQSCPIIGAGIQRPVSAGVNYYASATYCGPTALGGVKVQFGLRVMPLLQLGR